MALVGTGAPKLPMPKRVFQARTFQQTTHSHSWRHLESLVDICGLALPLQTGMEVRKGERATPCGGQAG